jgi:hypothetical protein
MLPPEADGTRADDPDIAVADDAGLLRRVHPKQVVSDKNLGKCRPASGAFKDKEMSVDAEPILHANGLDWRFSLRNSPGFSLVRFPAREARAKGLRVVHRPRPSEQPDNPAHTEVLGTTEAIARHFALVCEWVHLARIIHGGVGFWGVSGD